MTDKKMRTRRFIEVAILLTCFGLIDKVAGANCPSGVTFTTQTVATTPSNRTRATIGVGEVVNITLNASPSGSVYGVWHLVADLFLEMELLRHSLLPEQHQIVKYALHTIIMNARSPLLLLSHLLNRHLLIRQFQCPQVIMEQV